MGHNIPKERIDGDYQVWVGYLRKPPPAVTGFDIPSWAPYAGWAAIGIFMWVWASGPVLKNRELRREVVGKYIYPQLEISQCKTEQERQILFRPSLMLIIRMMMRKKMTNKKIAKIIDPVQITYF